MNTMQMNTLENDLIKETLQQLHKASDENFTMRMRERDEALAKGIDHHPSKKNAYMSVTAEEGKFLYFLADVIRAQNIVEFGCSFGISAIYLAAAAKNHGGHVTTTELEPNKVEGAQKNIATAGLQDYVTILPGDATQTLTTVNGPIDFLFLDGAKELYLPVFNLLKDKLSPRAIVFADNADHAGAQPLIDYLEKTPSLYTTTRLVGGRVLLAHYIKS